MTASAYGRFVAALVANPSGALIGCDFDGTLAPIVADPADSRPVAGSIEVLVRLAQAGCRVCVITGRPADQAAELGGLDRVPGLVVLGHYGGQRWSHGVLTESTPVPGLTHARRRLVEVIGDAPIRLEDKGLSVAVHTREALNPAAALAALQPAVEAIARESGLQLEAGRYVLELRAPGTDKGAALTAYAAEIKAHAVLFIGDDLGDLPAFAAAQSMPTGLAVAVASAEVPQISMAASLSVDGPVGVVALLTQLAQLVE